MTALPVLVLAFAMLHQVQAPKTLTVKRDLLVEPAMADLTNPHNMAISPSGEIAVGQMKDNHVKVFSPAGAMTTIGRKGAGPGEFVKVSRVGYKGDTLWALDPGASRVTLFTPQHKFVRTFREPTSGDKSIVQLFTQAVLPDGDLRVIVGFWSKAIRPKWAPSSDSGSTLFARVSPAGIIRRTIAVLPPSACRVSRATGSMITTRAVPYCAETLRTDNDGSLGLAFVEVIGTQYRVTTIGPNDDTLFARSFHFAPIPVSAAALDSVAELEAEIKKMTSPADWAVRPRVTPAKNYPPVRNIVLGRDNTVWLELRTTTGGHRWLMLDPKGNPVGTIVVPNEVTLKAAERGTVWGLITDEDGLLGVVRYRVSGS